VDCNKIQKGWADDYNANVAKYANVGISNDLKALGNYNYNGNENGNNNQINSGNSNMNNNKNNNYNPNFNSNINSQLNLNNNHNNNNLYNVLQNPNIQKQSSMGAYSNPVNDPIMQRLREKILSRGVKGIIGIKRSFNIADRNLTGFIDNDELIKLLKNYRFELTDVEFRKLFEIFDSNRNGKINFDEFLNAIVGEMNEFRRSLVTKAFMIFDKSGNERVDIDDIRGSYNAKMHPDVKSGKKTEDEVLSSFLDIFEANFSLIVS
jgi:hypothetical protein